MMVLPLYSRDLFIRGYLAPPTGSGSMMGVTRVGIRDAYYYVARRIAKGSPSPEATRSSNRWLVNARAARD